MAKYPLRMTQRNRRRHRRRGGARSKTLFVGVALLGALAAVAIGVASWVLNVAAKAPPLSDCRPIERGGNSILFAGDGSRLGYIASDEARTPVSVARVPEDLKYATVAIEDERFFQHDGIDYEGGIRALIENLEAGKIVQGGSTITMQLMRNLCIADPQRNLERKIQEAQLALEYERKFSKQDILGKYLNTASYGTINGSTAVGVQAASRIYFSKPVWKLTLEQAALLAGLPQAPSDYNPILNPKGALARRNEVLSSMAKLGYISRSRALEGQQRGLRAEALRHLLHPRAALLLRLRRGQADREVRGEHGAQGRAAGLHHGRPEPPGRGAGGDALRPALLDRPLDGAGRDRPREPATSRRWSPAPTTTRASSTSPRRGAASRGRPSRPSC